MSLWGDILETRVQTRVVRDKRLFRRDVISVEYRVLDRDDEVIIEKAVFQTKNLFIALLYSTGVSQKGIKAMREIEAQATRHSMTMAARDKKLEKLLRANVDLSVSKLLES